MRAAAVALLVTVLVAGCGAAGVPRSDGRLTVVAAENFWGSLAAELGGDRVAVTSVVSNPAADPHDYEPTAKDARAFAVASLAIVNGAGYDAWASRLLAANPVSDRITLDVGRLVGVHAGQNPHRWYSPGDVQRVIAAITADYKRLDPRHARYFDARRAALESAGLAPYRRLIASIRARYAGTPVGASESIFAPLAQALGLRLVTPSGFLDAVSEGADPPASSKATADSQIADRRIGLWVYNSQNATPDVKRLTDEARARGIPVATLTETLAPASATFSQWQSRQLEQIERALASGAHR